MLLPILFLLTASVAVVGIVLALGALASDLLDKVL